MAHKEKLMFLLGGSLRQSSRRLAAVVCVLALLSPTGARTQQQGKISVLRIGTSGTLSPVGSDEKEALQSLQNFIKDETGFANELIREKDWQELAEKMTKGDLHLGVFKGYEFAWAQQKYPDLKPLALAENTRLYTEVYVVTRRDNPAMGFAGLQGQSLALPNTGQPELRLFVAQQCQAQGKKLNTFFAKVTSPNDVEEALDNVVDGVVQAAVADYTSLDAYKGRKPGRFKVLHYVARSKALPPPVVAYYNQVLDQATLKRFQQGLLNASKSDRGQTLLTLFRLTDFAKVPGDFNEVLAETRKKYPPGTDTK
jgi:ABC-type phosphate/phosphonate transport system substrate-binding protein